MHRRDFVIGLPVALSLPGCELLVQRKTQSPKESLVPDSSTVIVSTPADTLKRTQEYSRTVRQVLEFLGGIITAAKPEKASTVSQTLKEVRQVDEKVQKLNVDANNWNQYIALAETLINLISFIPVAGQYVTAIKLVLTIIEAVRVASGLEKPRAPAPSPCCVPLPDPPAKPLFESAKDEALIRIGMREPVIVGDQANQELQNLLAKGLKP